MRNNMQKWCPAEKACYAAAQEVENMAAHPLLTDAVILLGQARDKIGEYILSRDPSPPPPYEKEKQS